MPFNIIVCVKQVFDTSYSIQIQEDPKLILQKGRALPAYIINPADKCAMEEALRIKQQVSSKIIVLSLGPDTASLGFNYFLARGADQIIHLCHSSDYIPDSYSTSRLLSNEINLHDYDLIFCGDKSIDHAGGLVGPVLAEFLDLPQITRAGQCELLTSEIGPDSDYQLRAHRFLERGDRQVIECLLPAVISVTPLSNDPPYIATSRILHASPSSITVKNINDITDGDPICSIESIGYPKPRPRKMSAPPKKMTAAERMKFMISGGQQKKNDSSLFEGSSEQAADKIISYLQENGFL
jgi:electron transfer flavoprotein beta subunit